MIESLPFPSRYLIAKMLIIRPFWLRILLKRCLKWAEVLELLVLLVSFGVKFVTFLVRWGWNYYSFSCGVFFYWKLLEGKCLVWTRVVGEGEGEGLGQNGIRSTKCDCPNNI
eukprot:m.13971 g.13971  ORF g.13971 m.13971 type:complete len:112 (+) comp25351_c0_seq3:372-707(+)